MMLITLLISVGLLAVPIVVLCAECLAALLPARRIQHAADSSRPAVDVLIPAHNEAAVIEQTLASVRAQLGPHDRVCVVADNCTDETAALAARCAALVVERQDAAHRGKGYALEFGLNHLAPDHAEVVLIVDADCQLQEGAIDRLARDVAATGQPVQSAYLMHSPQPSSPRDLVSQFAVNVKNYVRQRGMARLGGPALLTGSGMAFPWDVLRAVNLASDNIVEDMQLGFDLLVAGHPPLFCPDAVVTAPLPRMRSAAASQRTRWEHGHLQTLLRQSPRMMIEAWRQRRPILLAAALDLVIPPLALLVSLWTVALVIVALVGVTLGEWRPLLAIAAEGALLLLSILAALRFNRARDAWRIIAAAPLYVAGKLPIYFRFLVRPQRAWLRTERDLAS